MPLHTSAIFFSCAEVIDVIFFWKRWGLEKPAVFGL
jgi:hypothetical protein